MWKQVMHAFLERVIPRMVSLRKSGVGYIARGRHMKDRPKKIGD
jgi:hypothetical protein